MLKQVSLDSSFTGMLVRSFTEGTDQVISEIKEEYGMDTGNFKNGGAWDIRFRRIKSTALQHNLVVLTRRRGIWNFVCAIDLDTGNLYIFSKEKNLDKVVKNFGKRKIHYFHAFVSLNSGPVDFDNQQMLLFESLTEEYEYKRLMEVQRILGDEYPLVKRVIFVVAQEVNRKIIGVEAKLFNRYFELVDKLDLSMYIAKDEYSDLSLPAELDEDEEESLSTIPKIKQSIKNRRLSSDDKIPVKKSDKNNEEEETV
ncbi:DUF5986 family protein [Paenibacillus aurantiacus]|uniref:DUF5986 family protein n=1 Tax=Paenibacillus aurantiacus TaxID=1936118 RepID=A0ABV5KRJ1_9BACL